MLPFHCKHTTALELISICQLLSQVASPKFEHEDAELRSIFRMCDIALRSAANSGTNVASEANARFKEATQVLSTLSGYSERVHRLDVPLIVNARMETAIRKDSVEREWSHVKSEAEWGPTMTVNFVLLQSPILSPHDPETIIRSSVPIHPCQRFFGTSAVMRAVHVSPSSRTLTSICVAL
ncbi:hypothetical protein EDB87DRAFT_571075 [Lactarius vividus]|nr:hypothetical protein EDB87DRAFT_571075 [Lactarius vividus]